MGYSLWGCKELDTTEQLSTAQYTHKEVGFREVGYFKCYLGFPQPGSRSMLLKKLNHQIEAYMDIWYEFWSKIYKK